MSCELNFRRRDQWRKSGWNSEGTQVGIRKAWWGKEWDVKRGYLWRIPMPLSRKKWILHLKWRVFVHSGRYFCPCRRQKILNSPPEVVIWWTLKMCFWEVVNTLLESWDWYFIMHCNASNPWCLNFKTWQNMGAVCISVSCTPNSRGLISTPSWFTPMGGTPSYTVYWQRRDLCDGRIAWHGLSFSYRPVPIWSRNATYKRANW